MKNTKTTEVSNNKIIEYLTDAAAHGGYYCDGVKIEPGTAVTCLKTIATQTGLSYYRVKKCIAKLVEAGRVTITRHKCFAIITFCPEQAPETSTKRPEPEKVAPNEADEPTAAAATATIPTAATQLSPKTPPKTTHPLLNRSERRRLARQEAKAAARCSRRI